MNDKTKPAEVALERPVRPQCWRFAMDFLGTPENEEVEAYVAGLEATTDRLRAALHRLLSSDPAIVAATDDELLNAAQDKQASHMVREQATAVLQGRAALRPND